MRPPEEKEGEIHIKHLFLYRKQRNTPCLHVACSTKLPSAGSPAMAAAGLSGSGSLWLLLTWPSARSGCCAIPRQDYSEANSARPAAMLSLRNRPQGSKSGSGPPGQLTLLFHPHQKQAVHPFPTPRRVGSGYQPCHSHVPTIHCTCPKQEVLLQGCKSIDEVEETHAVLRGNNNFPTQNNC